MAEGTPTPEMAPPPTPNAEIMGMLRNTPTRDRLTRVTNAVKNKVTTSPAFKEGGTLVNLTQGEDSVTNKAAKYDISDPDIKKQSPHLEALVRTAEHIAETTGPDGEPIDPTSQEILELLEPVRVQEVNDAGEPVGDMQTREQWKARLDAITDPAEKAALESKGIWQFVGLDETPTEETVEAARTNDDIIDAEIKRLSESAPENQDAQSQLTLLRLAKLAQGKYKEALKREVLLNITDTATTITPEERQQVDAQLPKDPANPEEALSMDRALGELRNIADRSGDKALSKLLEKNPDPLALLQNRHILTKHGNFIRSLFFGQGDMSELNQLVDPNHLNMLETYAKKGGLGLLGLLALIAFLTNAGINEMKSVAAT